MGLLSVFIESTIRKILDTSLRWHRGTYPKITFGFKFYSHKTSKSGQWEDNRFVDAARRKYEPLIQKLMTTRFRQEVLATCIGFALFVWLLEILGTTSFTYKFIKHPPCHPPPPLALLLSRFPKAQQCPQFHLWTESKQKTDAQTWWSSVSFGIFKLSWYFVVKFFPFVDSIAQSFILLTELRISALIHQKWLFPTKNKFTWPELN